MTAHMLPRQGACPVKTLLCAGVAAVLLCCQCPNVHAGAWCMKKGALYSKLSHNWYFTVDTFDDRGHKRRNENGSWFRDHNVTWYGEYGLLDRVTIFASLPYKNLTSHVRSLDEDGRTRHRTYRYHGFGDLETGLRLGLLRDPVVVSLQGLAKLAWLYDGHEDVPPGNNQNDYELKLLVGKSLWPFPGYCGLELGYRWRTNAPSDEYRYLVEFGMNVTERIACRVKLDGIKSVKNARLPAAPEPDVSAHVDMETGQVIKSRTRAAGAGSMANPSLGYEYDLGKLECTLSCRAASRWWLELTYTGYPYGENIAAGDQYSCALVYYFE